MDSLVDPLQKTINFKPKQDAVKQEVDRNEDMIRSALRAIASLNRIRFVFQMHLVSSFSPVEYTVSNLDGFWNKSHSGMAQKRL